MAGLPKWVDKIMIENFEKSWANELSAEFDKDYFFILQSFVENEYKNKTVFPEKSNIFRAFELTPIDNVSVVILGQDPYHGTGQANGLCFSVNDGVALPPSLKNIFKELKSDLNIDKTNGDLSTWATNGILLLNSVLTVEQNNPASHANMGWELFTDAVIKTLSKRKNIVYILWGSHAIKKAKSIDDKNNLIIKSPHPSPLSSYRGFFGSRPFSKTNEYLINLGKKPVFL